MTAQIYTCPKCGRPYEFFYNAGMPVWGCKRCFMNERIHYSDHTAVLLEPLKGE